MDAAASPTMLQRELATVKVSRRDLERIIKEELESVKAEESASLQEAELLNENPIVAGIMTALKNPAVQKMLMDALMPLLTQKLGDMAGDAGDVDATTEPDVTPAT